MRAAVLFPNHIEQSSDVWCWENILGREATRELSEEATQLIDSVAKLGHTHAKSKRLYKQELIHMLDEWSCEVQQETRDFALIDNYNVYAAVEKIFNGKCEQCRERENVYMKRLLPLSYAIWGALCFALSCLFCYSFWVGTWSGVYLVGPWTNLMLCIASVGLTITVILAVVEWVKSQNGQKTKEKRNG